VFTPQFLTDPPELPPGAIVDVVDRLTLPEDMKTGKYSLALGIVGEGATDPVVRLAIKGRSPDGWYPLSEVLVRE
jgi:hypothetical protein